MKYLKYFASIMAVIIEKNISLDKFNSFGVHATSAYFFSVTSESELQQLYAEKTLFSQKLVLGGGSNILFTKNLDGLTIKMDIPGISHEIKNDDVWVTAGAGVVWNDLVQYCLTHEFCGIENLILIPGSVGASPVQNIGAYGVELMSIFHKCNAFDTLSGEMVTLFEEDCGFSYRDSIFKNKEKNRYIITQVTLKLSRIPHLHLSYGAIQEELEKRQLSKPGIQDVAKVIASIRTSKLPDPSTIGNAGSFFKNPLVDKELFQEIYIKHPNISHYPAENQKIKLAAGWLIEQAGWKGKRIDDAGTWKHQALVLVNHGKASGEELYNFSNLIISDVKEKFGITLEREVNII